MTDNKKIGESELILNPSGSVYHLNLLPENLASHIILVGDPDRVAVISSFFDSIEYKGQNREMCTHTGMYKNKRITALSTGMGTDNIDIVLNELDALVNIDLKTRTIKSEHQSLNLIRLGTSGAIQQDIPLNSFIISEYGCGFDGMLYYYDFDPAISSKPIKDAFVKHTDWNTKLPTPYVVKASEKLMNLFADADVYKGITVTAPGFYGPQGRRLRIPLAYPNINDLLESFEYDGNRILNYEMETSALYGLGKILGHETMTVCVAIANRHKKVYNHNYPIAVEKLIHIVLDKIAEMTD